MELPAQNARLQKQREFLQQRRGGKEKSASYWGLSEIHRRLFHIVPTAPAPDGGDFLPPIAVTGSWPHTHSISLLFGKSIQKPDNIRLADKNKRRGLPEIRQEGKKWKNFAGYLQRCKRGPASYHARLSRFNRSVIVHDQQLLFCVVKGSKPIQNGAYMRRPRCVYR